MRINFLLSLLLAMNVLAFTASATGNDYSVARIPPLLLRNANAVLRLDETRLEILNSSETILTKHYAITILNESAADWAELVEFYDQLTSIEAVDGYLYDALGRQLKKVKKKDLEDGSAVGSELMTDDRYKRHNFYYRTYPYTIEYHIVKHSRNSLMYPIWAPQTKSGLAVEQSSMSITCDKDYQFRYKAFNYPSPPVTDAGKRERTERWELKNLFAIALEPYSPRWHEIAPTVVYGPTTFQFDSYKGNMSSWAQYSKFIQSLNAGRDQLPADIKQAVHKMVDGIPDTHDRIRILYRYMQQHTRYISIQLGIGGWQPFDAKFVAANGYGDCKALSNYMYSLLKEVGIKSYQVDIRAGRTERYLTEDFPSQQFTHVILCVPLAKDTTWLECTSQTIPAGYISDFTDERAGLLIDADSGRLVRTPRYGAEKNLQSRNIAASLDVNGTLSVTARSRYQANQQDELHQKLHSLSSAKMREYLHSHLALPTYEINDFNYSEDPTTLPSITETLDISVPNYASVTGKRLFIVPNILSRSTENPGANAHRKTDALIIGAYSETDTVEISLPPGYAVESMPADVQLNTVFGVYSCTVKLMGNTLVYRRIYRHLDGRFGSNQYSALVNFYNAVYRADQEKVVLVAK